MLVLGLVFKRHWNLHHRFAGASRRPHRRGYDPNALYPINFDVKHPNLPFLTGRPALRRLKPAGPIYLHLAGLFRDRSRSIKNGSDHEAANEFWWS